MRKMLVHISELVTVALECQILLDSSLAESGFSSDHTGISTPCKLRFVMHGGATKRPVRFHILLDPHLSFVWINAAHRRGDIDLCAG